MPSPLYFDPDPEIDDADLLGIGNLIYDDGTTGFIQDPEISSMFPRYDAANNQNQGLQDPQTGELMQPPQDVLGADTFNAGADMAGQAWDAQKDIFSGAPPPGQQQDDGGFQPMPSAPHLEMNLDGQVRPAQGDAGAGAPPDDGGYQPMPSAPHLEMNLDGHVRPAGSGGDAGYGTGGLQLAAREGALPPDVAQQQAAEMSQQHQASMDATLQSRNDQAAAYDQFFSQRKAELDAEKAHQEEQVQEQVSRQQRLQKEQTDTAGIKLETDLVSAQGWAGAIFSVLGATLLGATGSDAGLRMIDSSIDQHVKAQISMRDSKLRVLADQLGSTEQAIAAAKSSLYRTTIDRASTMLELTKNDAYQKQTPEVMEGLKQKYLEEEQKFTQLSLGKPLEKAPVAPKGPTPAQVKGYGEASMAQSQGAQDAQRALLAIGGKYDPTTGKIINKDEILKNGIPGVGKWDSFVNDLGKLPFGIGSIPQAVDSAFTSQQGTEVKAALGALIEARASMRNPGRAPTDADRDAARNELGLKTEAGTIDAIERILNSQKEVKASNVGTYGVGAASQVESTVGAMGGRPAQPTTSPGNVRPLTPGSARDQIKTELGGTDLQGKPSGQNDATPEEFKNALAVHAEEAQLNPEAIAKVIGHESGGSASATNSITGAHAGLIQFSKPTWTAVAKSYGTPDITWEDMRKMSAEDQLPYVMEYYKMHGLGPNDDAGTYALATFMPAFVDKPDDFVLGEKGSKTMLGDVSSGKVWQQNPGLRGADGRITVGSVKASVL